MLFIYLFQIIRSEKIGQNTTSKKRIHIQAERREILRKIDKLQVELDSTIDKQKRNKINEEIFILGKLLQQKVVNKVSDHSNKNNDLFKAAGKKLGSRKKAFSMDYNEYVRYKKQNLSDKKIAIIVGATEGQITAWKHRNRITQEKWKEAN